MSDIVELCDKLENCRIRRNCDPNGIICARKLIQDYIGQDHNKLLQLKAEVMLYKDTENEHVTLFSTLISIMTFIFSILIVSNKNSALIFGFIAVITILIINGIEEVYTKRKNAHKKWIRYIEVIIADIKQ